MVEIKLLALMLLLYFVLPVAGVAIGLIWPRYRWLAYAGAAVGTYVFGSYVIFTLMWRGIVPVDRVLGGIRDPNMRFGVAMFGIPLLLTIIAVALVHVALRMRRGR